MYLRTVVPLLLASCAAVLGGCAPARQAVPPAPEPVSVFFGDQSSLDQQEYKQHVPFKLFWLDDQVRMLVKDKPLIGIYIPAIDIEYLITKEATDEEVVKMSKYLREKFSEAATAGTNGNKLQVLADQQPDGLTLQLAILKLEPTNALLNTTTNILGLFIPGSILATTAASAATAGASHELAKGTIAIGIKLKTNDSNKLLAEAYDERQDRAALIINANDFSKYGNAKESVSSWSKDFYEIILGPPDLSIDSPSSFAVVLW